QRTVAWLGSPANTLYNWVVTANNLGTGTCPQNIVYTNFSYIPPIVNCTFNGTSCIPTLTAQVNATQLVTPLNECVNPNRLAGTSAIASLAQLYPNPANNELIAEIELSENETAELVLIDMTGRVVRTESLGNQSGRITQNVSDMPEGIYLCIIRTADRTLLEQKVVISH
ncbi:MAG: T9SS type A sorting domain-containing protein, partial [Bacteroidia bacterium]